MRKFESSVILENSEGGTTGLSLTFNPEEFDMVNIPLDGCSRVIFDNKETFLLLDDPERGTSYIVRKTVDGELHISNGPNIDGPLTKNRVLVDSDVQVYTPETP